jgi:parvulin-like peptidyl-prolyl isomerase
MMATRARQMFIDTEVPDLLKEYEVNDMTELDEKLRGEGSSLHARQRDFTDAMLGHMYVRESVDREPEVSLAEIVCYYQAHQTEFEHKAQARWEQLTVLFKNFPTRKAAHQAISEMGREAFFGGSMQAVARAKSQEPLAQSGGVHDWTNQGSLASDELDKNIFSLPLNEMSEIIEDQSGYHIIRVLERKAAGVTPLSEVQETIRKKIQQQKVATAQREMMDKMKELVPVWTMFPDDVPGAKPLPQVAKTAAATNLR